MRNASRRDTSSILESETGSRFQSADTGSAILLHCIPIGMPLVSPFFTRCTPLGTLTGTPTLLFDYFPVRLTTADHDSDRLKGLHIRTDYLQHTGDRHCQEHTSDSPDIAPKRE